MLIKSSTGFRDALMTAKKNKNHQKIENVFDFLKLKSSRLKKLQTSILMSENKTSTHSNKLFREYFQMF